MGLLDDAIREHLDLKRRRGADPAEVERAEREALGPVRRNREIDLSEEPEYAEAGSARDEDDEGIAADLVDRLEPEGTRDRGPADDVAAPRVAPVDDDVDPFADEDEEDPFAFDERDEAEPQQARESPPAAAASDDAPPTQLMRAADLPDDEDDEEQEAGSAQAAGDEDDDVLEETPEFLQDTPDHDRLWFEQRPPRDFDFDG